MNEIRLSGEGWRNPDSFWDDFLTGVGAPEWHGRNLNALNDSIGGGSINAIEAPLRIVIQDVADIPKSVVFLLTRIAELFDELQFEGIRVELAFPDGPPPGWDYVNRREGFCYLSVLDILREWDPIGVYGPGSRCPDDEYDGYASGVISLLERDKSAEEIARHLGQLARQSMGLTETDPQIHLTTAGRLIEFWKQCKSHRHRQRRRHEPGI